MSAATAAIEEATAATASTEQFEPKKQEALALVTRAQTITIIDPESYNVAAEMVKEIRTKRTWWKSLVAPVKEMANKAHKAACKLENDVDGPLELAEKSLTRGMITFSQEQERIRQKAEQALREQQAKTAREEADRRAQEQQIDAAIEAQREGDTATAEAILQAPTVTAPVYVPPVIVPTSTPKVAGVSTRENWQARVVDEALVPKEFLMVDLQKLAKYAKAMKQQAKVAGVEFYDAATIAIRL